MTDIASLSSARLLELHSDISELLRKRGVVRSANKPTGDLAEYIFCKEFGWHQSPNSEHGFDATDREGIKYQIKARRLTPQNKSRQLSAIRNLASRPFDVLAGVLFDKDYQVFRAALIPYDLVNSPTTRFSKHTNSHLFHLRDSVWNLTGVIDVTTRLQSVEY